MYPPLRWWPLRVMNPWQKFGVLVVQNLGLRLIILALGLVLPSAATSVVGETLVVITIIATARSFRGADEPVLPPRPWWRLSARPLIGWWLGAGYLLGALSPLLHPERIEVNSVLVSVELAFLGLAFLNSSIRLTALRRHPQI